MREALAERAKDLNDGLSVRSLFGRLAEHAAFDEKRHGELENRIRTLEHQAARSEGLDTGRFQLPPQQLPPVAINVNGKPSKRPSMMLLEAAKKPAMMILIALATVLAHAIVRLLK